jgi:hypothetical protein
MSDVSDEVVSLRRQFLGSEGAILLRKQARFAGAVHCSFLIATALHFGLGTNSLSFSFVNKN